MDDILRQSGKLSINDNIQAFTRIYREIGVLLRILPFVSDFRFRFAISVMRNFPGRSRGVIIFFVILLLLLGSSLKISFDYSAFGCPPSPPEVIASNLISRYPSPAGRDTHESKIEPAWPTILEYRFLPGLSHPMVRPGSTPIARPATSCCRRLRFIDDGGGSGFYAPSSTAWAAPKRAAQGAGAASALACRTIAEFFALPVGRRPARHLAHRRQRARENNRVTRCHRLLAYRMLSQRPRRRPPPWRRTYSNLVSTEATLCSWLVSVRRPGCSRCAGCGLCRNSPLLLPPAQVARAE
jgi:hypothetical protein